MSEDTTREQAVVLVHLHSWMLTKGNHEMKPKQLVRILRAAFDLNLRTFSPLLFFTPSTSHRPTASTLLATLEVKKAWL